MLYLNFLGFCLYLQVCKMICYGPLQQNCHSVHCVQYKHVGLIYFIGWLSHSDLSSRISFGNQKVQSFKIGILTQYEDQSKFGYQVIWLFHFLSKANAYVWNICLLHKNELGNIIKYNIFQPFKQLQIACIYFISNPSIAHQRYEISVVSIIQTISV